MFNTNLACKYFCHLYWAYFMLLPGFAQQKTLPAATFSSFPNTASWLSFSQMETNQILESLLQVTKEIHLISIKL